MQRHVPEVKNGFQRYSLISCISHRHCVFGTKRLRNIGTDLGGAIKGFRAAVAEGGEDKPVADKGEAIEGEVIFKNDKV